jgi:tRNA dimethylallyltransferase
MVYVLKSKTEGHEIQCFVANFGIYRHGKAMEKTIHIIAGPTASGKSALAMERAIKINGAVVNCDSKQIYDGLPILTAQPSKDDFEKAPHHLYGTVHPNEVVSAGSWRDMTAPLIEKLLADGVTPIITGGNGLYIKTLMEGISPIPEVPAQIRLAAIEKQKQLGNPGFYEELQKRDPETAAKYHPMHTARLIHAWEILEATGKPLAHWQAIPKIAPPEDWVFDITLVMPDRDKLYANCNARFEQMLSAGAMDELNAFDKKVEDGHVSGDAILIKTVGAAALRAWREGRISREDAINLAQTETRQYAKRQTTWFNNQVKPQKNIVAIKRQA